MRNLIIFSLFTFVIGIALGMYYLRSNSALTPVGTHPDRDFTLYSYNQTVHLHDFKGKLVLLFFGYTSCPDVCPLTLKKLVTTLDSLSEEERKQVQVLFISVDPQRDTVDKIHEYTKYFDNNIIGLTGTEQQIAQVAKLYAADYKKVASTDKKIADPVLSYTLDHTSSVYVINRDNIWVGLLPSTNSVDQWLEAIQGLL